MNKAAIFEELEAILAVGRREEGEFSRQEFAEATERTKRIAETALEFLVEQGVLTKRMVTERASRLWVYKRVEANDGG